jgi:hypothetical protein
VGPHVNVNSLGPSELIESGRRVKRRKGREDCGETGYNGSIKTQQRGADKSLAQPGRKQATATKYFDVTTSYNSIDRAAWLGKVTSQRHA